MILLKMTAYGSIGRSGLFSGTEAENCGCFDWSHFSSGGVTKPFLCTSAGSSAGLGSLLARPKKRKTWALIKWLRCLKLRKKFGIAGAVGRLAMVSLGMWIFWSFHSTSKSSGLKKTSTSAENQLGDIALEITGDVSHRLVLISAVWSSFQQRKTCESGDLSGYWKVSPVILMLYPGLAIHYNWLVVWNIFYFPQHLGWWSNLTYSYFSRWLKPPTR